MPKKKKTDEWVPWELRRENPDIFYFKEEDTIPNSPLPVLIYRGVFDKNYEPCEEWLIKKFVSNKWIYNQAHHVFRYCHYYSNTHVVLGICSGNADLSIGGTSGITARIEKGDVVIVPAGVGLQLADASKDFKLVGAYSTKDTPTMMKDDGVGRALAEIQITATELPDLDPILGPEDGLLNIWD